MSDSTSDDRPPYFDLDKSELYQRLLKTTFGDEELRAICQALKFAMECPWCMCGTYVRNNYRCDNCYEDLLTGGGHFDLTMFELLIEPVNSSALRAAITKLPKVLSVTVTIEKHSKISGHTVGIAAKYEERRGCELDKPITEDYVGRRTYIGDATPREFALLESAATVDVAVALYRWEKLT